MNIAKLLKDGLARYKVKHKSVPKAPRAVSKHTNAKRKPRDWHQRKRRKRKAQKLARRRNR